LAKVHSSQHTPLRAIDNSDDDYTLGPTVTCPGVNKQYLAKFDQVEGQLDRKSKLFNY